MIPDMGRRSAERTGAQGLIGNARVKSMTATPPFGRGEQARAPAYHRGCRPVPPCCRSLRTDPRRSGPASSPPCSGAHGLFQVGSEKNDLAKCCLRTMQRMSGRWGVGGDTGDRDRVSRRRLRRAAVAARAAWTVELLIVHGFYGALQKLNLADSAFGDIAWWIFPSKKISFIRTVPPIHNRRTTEQP